MNHVAASAAPCQRTGNGNPHGAGSVLVGINPLGARAQLLEEALNDHFCTLPSQIEMFSFDIYKSTP
jgi:hypothetical protein